MVNNIHDRKAWEQENPPQRVDPAPYDYQAEDEAAYHVMT